MGERVETLERKKDDPNVIVGMSPEGLVAALELAKSGHPVLILEKQAHFTTGEKVRLETENIAYLKKIMSERSYPEGEGIDFSKQEQEDANFIKELEALEEKNGAIEVSKIQEYLKRQLEKYPELIEVKQSTPNAKIGVQEIVLADNKLKYYVENSQTHEMQTHEVQFKHLIAADGASHETAALARLHDDFVVNEFQPRQETHGAVTLELSQGIDLREEIRRLHSSDLSSLQGDPFYWDKPYLPTVYIWPDSSGKIYITGEVPSGCLKLTGAEQQKALENWAKTILEKTYGYTQEETSLSFDAGSDQPETEKNKPKATAFGVTLKYAAESARECDPEGTPGEHTFIRVGDASRSAHPLLAHGINDAIKDGIAVAKCMGKKKSEDNIFDVQEFNKRHVAVQDKISQATQVISWHDHQHYAQLTAEHQQQFRQLIGDIRKNILPCVTEKKKRKEITDKIKQIESLARQNRYGEVFVKAEEVFNVVQKMLDDDTKRSHFSKSLPELAAEAKKKKSWFFQYAPNWLTALGRAVKQEPEVGKKDEKAVTEAIDSKKGMLTQFRGTAQSLDELTKLARLKLGERLPEKSPSTPSSHPS